jgi:predicted nucleic acid-binding protein
MDVALDTNIIMYAHDVRDDVRRERARDLLERALRLRGVLPRQAIGEFVAASRKLRDLAREDAVFIARSLSAAYQVVASTEADFDAGLDAHVSHGLGFWDALIWATSRSAGCRWLLTEDLQDGRTLGGVTFVNPFAPANDALVDRILPPVSVA